MTVPAQSELLPTRQVCARYRVNIRTVERWLENDKLGFPQPIYINKRRYFHLNELEAFERQRPLRRTA
jgi:Helix-turn-helix domain